MLTIILSLILIALISQTHASSLSSLQQIVGFPQQCTDAYNTDLDQCQGVNFAPFTTVANCNQNCFNQLNSLMTTIQRACASTGAAPDTVIGHAFLSDLGYWLCGVGPYANNPVPSIGSGPASNLLTTSTNSIATSSTASLTFTPTDSTLPTTSSTTSSSTSKTASPKASSAAKSKPTGDHGGLYGMGDSTPFDQLAYSNAVHSLANKHYILIAMGIALFG